MFSNSSFFFFSVSNPIESSKRRRAQAGDPKRSATAGQQQTTRQQQKLPPGPQYLPPDQNSRISNSYDSRLMHVSPAGASSSSSASSFLGARPGDPSQGPSSYLGQQSPQAYASSSSSFSAGRVSNPIVFTPPIVSNAPPPSLAGGPPSLLGPSIPAQQPPVAPLQPRVSGAPSTTSAPGYGPSSQSAFARYASYPSQFHQGSLQSVAYSSSPPQPYHPQQQPTYPGQFTHAPESTAINDRNSFDRGHTAGFDAVKSSVANGAPTAGEVQTLEASPHSHVRPATGPPPLAQQQQLQQQQPTWHHGQQHQLLPSHSSSRSQTQSQISLGTGSASVPAPASAQRPAPLPLAARPQNAAAPPPPSYQTTLASSAKRQLTYATTSPSIIKVATYLRPVIALFIEKCPDYPEMPRLQQLMLQSDSYIAFQRAKKTKKTKKVSAGAVQSASKGTTRSNSDSSRRHRHSSSTKSMIGDDAAALPEQLYPGLATYNLASENCSAAIPASSNLTEEQMLQCVGCYFLAYHSIYPFLESGYWYRMAKKTWRNMEYGIGCPSSGLSADASQRDVTEVAIIFILVALGAQECPRSAIFSGIASLDWSRCYYTRATELMNRNNLYEYPPTIRLAQFGMLASLFESTSRHDKKAISYIALSLKTCDSLNMRASGTVLNEYEKRQEDPATASPDENPGHQFGLSKADLCDGHRTYIMCFLWARLVWGLQENFMPHSIVNPLGSPDVSGLAFKSIGFHGVTAIRKRIGLQDLLSQIIEYATSMYFVEDPINSLRKVEQSMKEAFSLPETNGDDPMEIDLNQYNLTIHFNFASGQGGRSPTSSSATSTDASHSTQPFKNELLEQKTRRWLRTHFIALYKFSRLLLYRPFPLGSLALHDKHHITASGPALMNFFNAGSIQLYEVITEIYSEMVYPKVRRHREREGSNSLSPDANSGSLARSGPAMLDGEEDGDFGMFDVCMSNIAAELSVALFLFFGLARPDDGLGNNNLGIQANAIDSFVGCTEFMISEQQEIDRHNLNSYATLSPSSDVPPSPAMLSSRQETGLSPSSSASSTPLNSTFSSTSSASTTAATSPTASSEISLIPSPTTDLISLVARIVYDPVFRQRLAAQMSDFDYLRIAKWLLSKQPSSVPSGTATTTSRSHAVNTTGAGGDSSLVSSEATSPDPVIRAAAGPTSGSGSSPSSISSPATRTSPYSDSRHTARLMETVPSNASSISSILNSDSSKETSPVTDDIRMTRTPTPEIGGGVDESRTLLKNSISNLLSSNLRHGSSGSRGKRSSKSNRGSIALAEGQPATEPDDADVEDLPSLSLASRGGAGAGIGTGAQQGLSHHATTSDSNAGSSKILPFSIASLVTQDDEYPTDTTRAGDGRSSNSGTFVVPVGHIKSSNSNSISRSTSCSSSSISDNYDNNGSQPVFVSGAPRQSLENNSITPQASISSSASSTDTSGWATESSSSATDSFLLPNGGQQLQNAGYFPSTNGAYMPPIVTASSGTWSSATGASASNSSAEKTHHDTFDDDSDASDEDEVVSEDDGYASGEDAVIVPREEDEKEFRVLWKKILQLFV